jgi:1-phosphofructokinase
MIHLFTANPALDLELILERPRRGKVGLLRQYRLEAGGKAVNIARFLKKWGVPYQLWLGAGGGRDPIHFLYEKLLKKEGLKAKFLDHQAPIRLNAVVEEEGRKSKYNHPGFPLTKQAWPLLLKHVKAGDFWVLTGRLPKGMNPSSQTQWIREAQKKGAKVLLDTSGKALKEGLRAKPWFFKVNLFELSEAVGRPLKSLDQVSAIVKKMGLTHGAITDGAKGAVVWDGEEAILVKFLPAVKSPLVVGAGDAFLAGYLKTLFSKFPLKARAVIACASGAAVAQTSIRQFNTLTVAGLMNCVVLKGLNNE